MTSVKKMLLMVCVVGLSLSAFAQQTIPKRVDPDDAKNHIGEISTVCGKVVDTKVRENAIAGYGFPVSFNLDQPEPNPVFYFVAFGARPAGPQDDADKLRKYAAVAVSAYEGKRVCVTGKISAQPSGGAPFILAADRSKIKPDGPGK
jgi:hypothetical protein